MMAAAAGIRRFVLVSSVAAVGPGPGDGPVTEETTPSPINNYGRSKLAGEQEARAFADRLPLSIVRPGAIYGPRERDLFLILQLAALGFRVKVGLVSSIVSQCYLVRAVGQVTFPCLI